MIQYCLNFILFGFGPRVRRASKITTTHVRRPLAEPPLAHHLAAVAHVDLADRAHMFLLNGDEVLGVRRAVSGMHVRAVLLVVGNHDRALFVGIAALKVELQLVLVLGQPPQSLKNVIALGIHVVRAIHERGCRLLFLLQPRQYLCSLLKNNWQSR